MKKKTIIISIIFVLLLLSVVFANSYVQALSKEEIFKKNVRNNEITEQCNVICTNTQETVIKCDNNCDQKGSCQIYNQNNNCINYNNQCLKQRNYNCESRCNNKQSCSRRMCNR